MKRVILISFLVVATIALHSTVAARDDRNATPPMALPKYDAAIAPYVARARATYPAAKKRYLAGLPPRHVFAVWMRLYQKDKTGKVVAAEDCFLSVDRIAGEHVYGRLANKPLIVAGYSLGDQVTGPESEIRNWMIVHPDGSEEGNIVGKYLERHYRLQ